MLLPALLPFIIFLTLLLWARRSLLFTSIVTLLTTWILVFAFWHIKTEYAFYSLAKGFFIAFDIFLIIAGALFFLNVIQKAGVISNISIYLEKIAKDYRVQVILLAWFFEAFIEGTAGFGTPGAIVVPLLVGLGFTPLQSVMIGLLGNSAPGVFGAAGTPIKVGFATVFDPQIVTRAAIFNLVGIIFPVMMLWLITGFRHKQKTEFWPMVPFALWSGIALMVPSWLVAYFGVEFPSIIGPIVGLIPLIVSIKQGWLMPKSTISLNQFADQKPTMSVLKSTWPYGLLIVLLIVSKVLIGSSGILLNFGLKHYFNYYNPGFFFVITGLITGWFFNRNHPCVVKELLLAIKGVANPFVIIILMSSMVQLMINSGVNHLGILSLTSTIAVNLKTVQLPLFAPFIGALGSMITGSLTISNLMFGEVLKEASNVVGLSVSGVLALQVVGAGAGNMTALADILAAETVVGLKNKEREVVLQLLPLCLLFLLLLGIIGLLAVSVSSR